MRRVTVVAALFCLLAVPSGVSQGANGASASVEPASATPGQDLLLVLRIESPEVAEVIVQEEVACTVTFPSGAVREPCQATGSTVEARLMGSGTRTYTFPYQAPAELGVYTVVFEANATLSVPPDARRAETTFTVVPPSDLPGVSGPNGTGGDGPDPATNDGAPGGTPGSGDDGEEAPELNEFGGEGGDRDAARLFVSGTVALGVVAVGLVANRWHLGGGS